MQAELEATKSAASSDVSALKESFEHQKTQFREKLEDSTKQIDHLQKPGLLFGSNSIKISNDQSKFSKISKFPENSIVLQQKYPIFIQFEGIISHSITPKSNMKY